jgi:hypothetical protein
VENGSDQYCEADRERGPRADRKTSDGRKDERSGQINSVERRTRSPTFPFSPREELRVYVKRDKSRRLTGLNEFAGQQIERCICVDGHLAQPSTELMDHQTGPNCSGIDGSSRSAGADLGLRLIEERRGIMLAIACVRGGQHADRFAQHSAVNPELAAVLGRAPNRRSARDAVDASEKRIANRLLGPIPIADHVYLN